MAIQREVGTDEYHDAMNALRAMQDWKLSVRWALTRVGLVGATILVFHLTRQQKSQANSFYTIAKEVGLTKAETELMFEVSLAIFIRELNDRQIRDTYWEEPVEEMASDRCAASEGGEQCPITEEEAA